MEELAGESLFTFFIADRFFSNSLKSSWSIWPNAAKTSFFAGFPPSESWKNPVSYRPSITLKRSALLPLWAFKYMGWHSSELCSGCFELAEYW